jgi:hypothetical protein
MFKLLCLCACRTIAAVSVVARLVRDKTIFTWECCVKIVSEGYDPGRFFLDAWNCLDFFIVVTGFIEMTPAQVTSSFRNLGHPFLTFLTGTLFFFSPVSKRCYSRVFPW